MADQGTGLLAMRAGTELDAELAELELPLTRDKPLQPRALQSVPGYRLSTADPTLLPDQRCGCAGLAPDAVTARTLAGDPITAILTTAPGNGAPIGGLKVATDTGWFAARPSGTEDVYKIYAESFRGEDHLAQLIEEAQQLVTATLERARG